MTTPRLRSRFPRAAAAAAFVLAAAFVAMAGQQPPEVEDPKAKPPIKKVVTEDEDPKGTIKKKVTVDDPGAPAKAPGNTPDVRLDELVQAAELAKAPALKDLFTRYAVPFDRLTDSKGAGRIKPIPLYRNDKFPKEFGVTDLGPDGQPKENRSVGIVEVKKFEYFEELALAEADQLLKQKSPAISADDQLAAAEKLLAAALRYHDYARDRNIRRGKGWDDVRNPLAAKLRDVRVQQLERATTVGDWQKAREFGTRLMNAYPRDNEIAQKVAVARVAEAELLMKSKDHADHVRARILLDEYLAKFPGGGGEQVRKLREQLKQEAVNLYNKAVLLQKNGNLVEARREAEYAAELDPTVDGLRKLMQDLGAGWSVLNVGVRRFPEKMSPATARHDSEKQAVELLFEGLLEEIPDGRGGYRYRPAAALAPPVVIPAGRDLVIRQSEALDAHDVVETVRLLRGRPDLWSAVSLPWLDDLPAPARGDALRIAFRHGHPDPRALLTFKLLPGRWFSQRGRKVDDAEFSAQPFGTGPYRIYSFGRVVGTDAREIVFADNPDYRRWKDREGQPRIREVRLIEATKLPDAIDFFRQGRLHMLPDLTPDEITRILSMGNEITGRAQIVTSTNPRRVQLLAVNHRRPAFQDRDLRRGLSQVIDREGILLDVFRSLRPEHRRLTAAMTGPFPPASWATLRGPAGQPVPLLDRAGGMVRLKNYLRQPGVRTEFSLAYPKDDPNAAAVCEKIKGQLDELFKDAAGGPRITLNLEPLDPDELFKRVNEEFRFDLAYLPLDYPDDWYPYGLAAFLDPAAAERGGRNVTGYLAPGTNPTGEDRNLGGELQSLLQHRDYGGEIVQRTANIHRLFNDLVPFIPLWQLDRHMLVHNSVKVHVDDLSVPVGAEVLNQTLLFQGVARWRVVRPGD